MDYENDTAWVRGMLHPGESLLWSGKPGKGHLFRKEDAIMIPFSILWCGFAVFWEISVIRAGAPLIFKLWGIPFVLVGLYLTVGRFLIKRIKDRKSRYALTSQRIIVANGAAKTTLDLTSLPRITVNQHADGSGDIRFGESAVSWHSGMRFERSVYPAVLAELRNIPDVNNVEYRIRTAVEQALRARRSDVSE